MMTRITQGVAILVLVGMTAVLLWRASRASCLSEGPPPAGASALVARIQHGEQVYNVHCRSCHGVEGVGGFGPSLAGLERKFADEVILDRVRFGAARMPGFDAHLSPEELGDLLAYVKSL